MAEGALFLRKESPRRDSYRLILGYVFVFLSLVGVMMLVPLLMLAFYPSEWQCYKAFLIPGGGLALVSGFLSLILLKGKKQVRLGKHQDSALLILIWLSAIAVSTLPLCLADNFDPNQTAVKMSFSEAFFEMASGFSTTGYTVFKDTLDGVEAYSSYGVTSLYCPHVFLFYRALAQFVGGVGLVLVLASVIADKYGMKLFYTEGHNDRLLPNLGQTAKLTFGIYSGFIALGTLVLWLFGLDWFEALCTSTSAMATGGFSTRSLSLYSYVASGYAGNGVFSYNALGAEITTMVVMLLGSISFLLLFRLVTFKWKRFFRDCEIRFTLLFCLIIIPLMAVSILYQYNNGAGTDIGTAFRYSSFQVISCLATTGYVNAPSVACLGQAAIYMSIIAMMIGGGAGSTAGGIKQYRICIALKELVLAFKYRLAPRQVLFPHYYLRDGENKEIDDLAFRENSNFIVLYVLVVIIASLGLSLLPGFGFGEAFYQVVSGITSGGNAILDPISYSASYPTWAYNVYLWVISVVMILGRLEILPFYFGAVRMVKDIFHKETV